MTFSNLKSDTCYVTPPEGVLGLPAGQVHPDANREPFRTVSGAC